MIGPTSPVQHGDAATRTRIVDDAHRGLSVAGERAVLVDGRVAVTEEGRLQVLRVV